MKFRTIYDEQRPDPKVICEEETLTLLKGTIEKIGEHILVRRQGIVI